MKSQYCAMVAIPIQFHHPIDAVLSAGLMGGAIFYTDLLANVNPWLAFTGGIVGLFIGLVRVYEILREYVFTNKKQ